jgi:hypothetical protein
MKASNSKDKPVKTPGPKPMDVKKTKPSTARLPTPEQLAIIAATLWGSQKTTQFWPSVLAKKAMELWFSARDTIFWADYEDKIGRQEQRWQDWNDASYRVFQRSDKYPVTREQFLKKMLPSCKDRAHELARIGKDYCKSNLRESKGREPTKDEVDNAFARWGPFRDHLAASTMALRFQWWYDGYVSKVRRAAGLKSAAKRKAKREAN